VSTVAAITVGLRSRILDGEFRGGDQLREVHLAEELGVARHSVRSALHLLSQQGLLVHQPNRGVFVREMTSEEVEDIFLFRSAIEVESVTRLASTGTVTTEVEDAFTRLADASNAPSGTILELDLEFHYSLVRATGSRRLVSAFADLMAELRLCLVDLELENVPSQQLTESHALILHTVRAATPALAAETVRAHLASSRNQLRAIHGWQP
jgi:DNA-binding GntR family transcriptional regulator